MFLSLGMHRGPLLAYLMADPELSLQSILIISKIIGRVKAWVYVGWVALFSVVAGLLYGAWVDGTSLWAIGAYLAAFLGVLALSLYLGRQAQSPAAGRRSESDGQLTYSSSQQGDQHADDQSSRPRLSKLQES